MDYRGNTEVSSYRGIRNNNPGNMKADGSAWQGLVGNDGMFYIFADDTWGIRAMAKDLTTKINSDGLNTITAIITKYAPPDENDTPSYIASVASDTGFDANQLVTADSDSLALLIRAIINHENGDQASQQFISDQDISQGIAMASDATTVFRPQE